MRKVLYTKLAIFAPPEEMKENYLNIRTADYTYDLPQNRIAKYPLTERDSSKLLVWDGKMITDMIFRELPSLIEPESLVVFNNTRVIRARLLFTKETGAIIEIFCLEPHTPGEFALNLGSTGPVVWKCLVGNLKRWKYGALQASFMHNSSEYRLTAERVRTEGDAIIVSFSWDAGGLTFADVLESMGHMPVPPYLGRDDDESDVTSYQTLYARINGSVAAPTAGLHFTPSVLDTLSQRGIERADVTLHVSAGTFRPVKSELISDHMMHTEHFFVTRDTLERLRGKKITAVGTTTVRTLESLYWLGMSSAEDRWPSDGIPFVSQWEPYESDSMTDPSVAIDRLLEVMERKGVSVLEAKTDIIIVPGYRFRFVSNMITNFHQPGSTLLLLIAAFTGPAWRYIYAHALSSGYRFLSYGDSMLLDQAVGNRQ